MEAVPSRARLFWLIGIGGATGTALRYAVTNLIGTVGVIPAGTLVVNVVGALLIGLLAGWLERSDVSPEARQQLRLLLGTGVLGGFTTYSALATATAEVMRDGRMATAMAYAAGSVAAGIIAAGLGLNVAGLRQ